MSSTAKAKQTAICRTLRAGFAFALLTSSPARASEVVTLVSGFSITCSARQMISPETVRLYMFLGEDTSVENYIDVPLKSVANIETVDNAVPIPGPPAAPSAPSLTALLQRSGAAHNVNAALLAAVIKAESAGNTYAVSRAGALGLMQLMPGTARQLGVKQSFEPGQNIEGGSTYLNSLLMRYHENVALALAAYNAGPAAVDRYHGIPPFPETRRYVSRVLIEFNRIVRQTATERTVAHPSSAAVVVPTDGSL